jgi:starvation-inducible DNA-binding protein
MTTAVTLHQPKQSNTPVAKTLQDVLTSTYGLYLATHNYHWNVEGENFVSLHKLFDEQYNELFQAIDGIAERIRALDDYALPFEGDNLLKILKTTSNSLNKETDANVRADRMVHNLMTLNEAVVKSCQLAKQASVKAHDDETENVMVERISAHQKAMWMLRSIVK